MKWGASRLSQSWIIFFGWDPYFCHIHASSPVIMDAFCPTHPPAIDVTSLSHDLREKEIWMDFPRKSPPCCQLQGQESPLIWDSLVACGKKKEKKSAHQCRRHRRCRFNPWVGNILWRRAWPPTPVFLPGKFHRWRNLAGYSPWGWKELDTTEHACAYLGRFCLKAAAEREPWMIFYSASQALFIRDPLYYPPWTPPWLEKTDWVY